MKLSLATAIGETVTIPFRPCRWSDSSVEISRIADRHVEPALAHRQGDPQVDRVRIGHGKHDRGAIDGRQIQRIVETGVGDDDVKPLGPQRRNVGSVRHTLDHDDPVAPGGRSCATRKPTFPAPATTTWPRPRTGSRPCSTSIRRATNQPVTSAYTSPSRPGAADHQDDGREHRRGAGLRMEKSPKPVFVIVSTTR